MSLPDSSSSAGPSSAPPVSVLNSAAVTGNATGVAGATPEKHTRKATLSPRHHNPSALVGHKEHTDPNNNTAYTEDQVKRWVEFRRMCDAIPELNAHERKWLDTPCLYRYLRARKWNLEKAFHMIRETLKWRKEFGVVEIMMGDLAAIEKESATGKMYIHGKDLIGRPIMYMKPRLQNTKDADTQIRHLVYTLERCVAEMADGAEKLVLVIDFKGYSIMNAPSFSQQRQTLSILQDHYPERLGLALCFDAPTLFWGAYKLISPFIDPVTASKIQFHKAPVKAGSAAYKAITDVISIDALEQDYGGESTFKYTNEVYFANRIVPECAK